MQIPISETRGIVEILNRLYLEIRALEERLQLIFGSGDYRPRVEYFHDAIRALTLNEPSAYEPGGRLSVERLSYDAAGLRYVSAHPLGRLGKDTRLSEGATLMERAENELLPPKAKPDRATKNQLTDLYQQYGVLFVALFQPFADRNHRDRVDEKNEEVEQLAHILNQLHMPQAEHLIYQLENEEAKAVLLKMLKDKKKKEMMSAIAALTKQADKDIKELETAHTQYAMAQLGLYENGKEIVKKLAENGMNLAGKFVADAINKSAREIGR